MLVKVNENYSGVFGLYDDRTKSVHAKRAGDPPFSVPDGVAERKIEEGVLVAASTTKREAVRTEPDTAKRPRRKK